MKKHSNKESWLVVCGVPRETKVRVGYSYTISPFWEEGPFSLYQSYDPETDELHHGWVKEEPEVALAKAGPSRVNRIYDSQWIW